MKTQDRTTNPEPADFTLQFAAVPAVFPEGSCLCFSARTSGLHRSRDGGQTWENAYETLKIRQALMTTCVALSPDFAHQPEVFAGLNGAILRSRDGGETWLRGRLPEPLPAISTLVISPEFEQDETLFAGTNEDGVLKSSDGGRNWISWNFGLLDLNILCLAISPDFGVDETLFAGTSSGLFRSTNGGRAWREVTLPFDFDAVLSLALSPGFSVDHTLFVGTENNGLMLSLDRGKTWQNLTEELKENPVNQIQYLPTAAKRDLLLLSGGSPLVSKDGGTTWKVWHQDKIKGRNVTAILAPARPGEPALVGFEDGRISKV